MAAAQCYGIDEVLEWAMNRKCPAWAIFQGTQFLFKYEGTDLQESLQFLTQVLTCIEKSDALYRIQFYDSDNKQPVKIKSNTQYDGSFNFKMTAPEVRENRMLGYAASQVESKLLARIDALEKKLAEPEQEEEPQTLGSALVDLVNRPGDVAMFVNMFRGLVGKPVIDFGTMGAVTQATGEAVNEEDKMNRIGNAIDQLESADPHFLNNIEALAKMSKEKPEQFKQALNALSLFK